MASTACLLGTGVLGAFATLAAGGEELAGAESGAAVTLGGALVADEADRGTLPRAAGAGDGGGAAACAASATGAGVRSAASAVRGAGEEATEAAAPVGCGGVTAGVAGDWSGPACEAIGGGGELVPAPRDGAPVAAGPEFGSAGAGET